MNCKKKYDDTAERVFCIQNKPKSVRIMGTGTDSMTFVKLSIKKRDMAQGKECFAFRRSFNQFAASLYKE